MIRLFPDQEEVRVKLRVALRSSASVLVFAPTGFGKTVLAAALIKMIYDAGKRIIFCVHRIDLIVQTAITFEKFGIPFSYIAAGHHYNPYHRVFIASIATLRNRLGKIPAGYVMVDEAHLSAAAGWAAVAKHYIAEGSKLIGLTGSPERLDGRPLGDVWQTMVLSNSLKWLIENGRLSKYRAFSPAGLDLSRVHSRNGEYVSAEIEDLMSGKAVLANAVKHWQARALGKRTLSFSPSVAGAFRQAEEFKASGFTAVALDGETPAHIRREAFIDFADRKIDVICNCRLFCEGFDLAAQVNRPVVIEAVLDNSPTMSLANHLQKHGRGLRLDDGDPHILLDMVGGFSRLGLPDEEHEWSLEGRKKTEREIVNMTCSECFASHEAAKACPECKFVYPVEEKTKGLGGRILAEIEMELEEIDLERVRKERRQEQGMAKSLEDLVRLATAKGFKSPEKWAAHVYTARQAKTAERMGARA